jgi:type IV pilus assembly protein PilC
VGIDISKIESRQKPKAAKKEGDFLAILNKDFSFSRGLSDKKKYRFYAELSLLISAGIDIRMALELTIEGEKSKKTQAVLQEVFDYIIKGNTLSQSILLSAKFSEYEYYSLKIGEESGNIREVLQDLANFYEGRIEFKRKLVSTFSYPVIVLVTALTAIFFMLNFIVPIFEDAFKRFGGELPYLTRLVLSLSEGIQRYGLISILVVLGSVLLLYTQRKQNWFRKYASFLLLKLPVIGEIAQKTYLARFCHSMSLLTGVNNPLVNSITLVRKMVRFYPLEKALGEIEQDILNGALFYKAMSRHTDIFPKRMISLVKVAEEVNKLAEVFDQIRKQYADETENSTKTISSLLEPFLIIFIGLFVGVILVAMYLPLFEIGSGMQ